MNKQICIIILLLTCRICVAQNLVPNGGFEQYTSCPTYVNQVDSCLFWTTPTTGSPDYFNSCALSTVGVPLSFAGYQPAHSGEGYCGLVLYAGPSPNYREYIEVSLTSPLVQNQVYQFQMYVCMGDSLRFSSDDFGVYFSISFVTGITTALFSFSPQIINTVGFYPDTMNWSLVSANYTANGGEQYLIIGNYKNDANTSTIQITNNVYTYAYLLVDDVSLTQNTGIDDLLQSNSIEVYPNPFKSKLIIESKQNDLLEIILYDIASRKLLQEKFTNTVSLNTVQLAKGLYLYEVRGRSGLYKKGKVVKD